ncbi:MAG: efflux RND transporter periplasmic adaptor subunit [Candidatus Latescibacterota bacterium]
MKKIIGIIVALALFGVGVHFFRAENGVKEEGPYQFSEITRGDLENLVSSTGTLQAVGTVEVGTQVSGTLDRLGVDFNDAVRKNQVLAVLDTTLLKIAVLDAEANLARVRAQCEQAQAEYARNLPLFEKGHISEQEFLPLRISVKMADASVRLAQTALERAQTNMDHAIIRSPIDGMVIQRNVEPGQTVAASFSTPTLFVIAKNLSQMEIYAAVDESDIGQIKEGQSVRFEVQAYVGRTFHGTVRQIRLQPTTIQNVVNYTVVVDAANEQNLLLPGMTATVDFVVEAQKAVLLVPTDALQFEPTEEMMKDFRKNRKRPEGPVRESSEADREGFRGRPGGEGGGFSPPEDMARLWFLDAEGSLSVVQVRKGATDGRLTEIAAIRGHIEEGMQIISGVTQQKKETKTDNNRMPSPSGFRRGPF